jgi:hypothetical protein
LNFRRLFIIINKKNKQHMPKDITVFGGESADDTDELNKIAVKP